MSNEQVEVSHLKAFSEALESGTAAQLRRMLAGLNQAEIAQLLEALPRQAREIIWDLIDPEDQGEVLLHVNDELRASLLKEMDSAEVIATTQSLDVDDLADLVQDLPATLTRQILDSMDKQNRARLETVLSFEDGTAGHLLNTDTITVRAEVALDVVIRYLRLRGDLPDLTDSLFVVSRYDEYLGTLSLSALLTNPPDATVAEVMQTDSSPITVNMPETEVAKLFRDYDLISAPVLDEQGHLLGRITIDDVVDVMQDEAEHTLMSMVGLDEEEDMFAPVIKSSKRRAVWLGINLVTAIIASTVIGTFENTIDQIVALAVLMPIVASMGGISGSQTLTMMIRAMALGQVGRENTKPLIIKEVSVAILNGLLWAAVVGVIAATWFESYPVGLTIAAAIVINLIAAASSGVLIPMALQRLGIDPALAGSVVLTTVTDIVGFAAFLGLATVFLL